MKNSKMCFSFTKIQRGKGRNLIFDYTFLNKDISITDEDIDMNFCMVLLHTDSGRNMSQTFYLGLSFYFILFT